jgi:hypothetical protein
MRNPSGRRSRREPLQSCKNCGALLVTIYECATGRCYSCRDKLIEINRERVGTGLEPLHDLEKPLAERITEDLGLSAKDTDREVQRIFDESMRIIEKTITKEFWEDEEASHKWLEGDS